MSNRHIRIVSLWIHPGKEAAFDAFEREAVRIMAKYMGRIDNAVRLQPAKRAGEGAGEGADTPYELHIVSFPDQAAYDSYLADPQTQTLREKRGGIISRTELMAGVEAGPY